MTPHGSAARGAGREQPRFLTYFFLLEPVMAHKDVGAIPFHLARSCGWRASIAFSWEGDEPPALDEEFARTVTPVPLGSGRGPLARLFRAARFLASRARDYDVANFYHDAPANLFLALVFKAFNPSGKTYLKLDMGLPEAERIARDESGGWSPARALKRLLSRKAIDVYSAETRRVHEVLAATAYFGGRIHHVPNGIDCAKAGTVDLPRMIRGKENIVLAVGRLGLPDKNLDLLVDALAMLDEDVLAGWKVLMVGPVVDRGFTEHLEAVIARRPHLRGTVSLTGNVADRETLYGIYRKARIFCFPSRRESFGIALAEAMFFANYVIATDLPGARDLTMDGALGALFPPEDVRGLRDTLEAALSGAVDLESRMAGAHLRIRERFDWPVIVKSLDGILR